MMEVTYDQDVDAIYIRFQRTTVTTQHLTDSIAVDYDASGHVAGIEILDARAQLGEQALGNLSVASA